MNTKTRKAKTPRSVYRSVVAVFMSAILAFVFMSDMTRAVVAIDFDIAEYESYCLYSQRAQEYRDAVATRMEAATQEVPYILLEDVSRRTNFERYFFMSDGSVMQETFAEPIHFAYDEWSYRKIDNSFVTRTDERGNSTIVNRSNAFQTEFAVNPNDNLPIASITSGEHRLQFFSATQNYTLERQRTQEVQPEREIQSENSERQSQNFETGEVTERRELSNVEVNSEFMVSDEVSLDFDYSTARHTSSVITGNLTSELSFANIEPNIDRRFEVTQFGMSENIIINERQRRLQFAFEFVIRAEGLELVNSNNRILAYDYMMERVFYIPMPYMFDAYGNYNTTDVVYRLEYLGDYEYNLTITACPMWINAADRAFPVQISSMNVQPLNGVVNNRDYFRIARIRNNNNSSRTWQTLSATAYHRGSTEYRVMIQFSQSNIVSGDLAFTMRNSSHTARRVEGSIMEYDSCLFTIPFNQLPTSPVAVWRELSVNQEQAIQIPFTGDSFAVVFRLPNSVSLLNSTVNFFGFRVVNFLQVGNSINQPVSFGGDDFSVQIDKLTLSQRAMIPYFIQEAPLMPIEIYGVFNPGFSSRRDRTIVDSDAFTLLHHNAYGLDMKLNIEQYMLPFAVSGRRYYIYIDAVGDFHFFARHRNDTLFRSRTTDLVYNTGTRRLGTAVNPNMFEFDTLGRLINIRSAEGQRKHIVSNHLGQITQVRNYIRYPNNNILFSTVDLTYTVQRQLRNIHFSGLTGSQNLQTTIEYNANRVRSVSNNLPTNRKNISLTYANWNNHHSYWLRTITSSANSGNGYTFNFGYNWATIRTILNYSENVTSRKNIFRDSYNGNPRARILQFDYLNGNSDIPIFTTHHYFEQGTNRPIRERSFVDAHSGQVARCIEYTVITYETVSYTYTVSGATRTGRKITTLTRTNYRVFDLTLGNTGIWHRVEVYRNSVGALIRKYIRQDTICNVTRNTLERSIQRIDSYGRLEREWNRCIRDYTNIRYTYDPQRPHVLIRATKRQHDNSDLFISSTRKDSRNSWGFPLRIDHQILNVSNSHIIRVSERFTYDDWGNVRTHTDVEGFTHSFEYGWLGGTTQANPTTRNMGIRQTTSGNERLVFNYNTHGILTSINTYDVLGTTQFYTHRITQNVSQDRNRETFTIGALTHQVNYQGGRLANISRNNVNMLTFTNNQSSGNITGITFANGQSMSYQYNAFGQMTSKQALDANGLPTQSFGYIYNSRGELWQTLFPTTGGLIHRIHSRTGNRSTVGTFGLTRGFEVTTTINPVDGTSIYHNRTGNVTPLRIDYRFGTNPIRQFSITENRGYLASNMRRTTVRDGNFVATYNSDRDGRMNHYSRGVEGIPSSMMTRQFNYTHGNRIDGIVDDISFGTFGRTITTTLGYDNAGNINSVISNSSGSNASRTNTQFSYRHGRLEWEEWYCYSTTPRTRRRIYYKYDANNNLARTYEYTITSPTQRTRVNAQRFNHSGDRLTSVTNTHRTNLDKTIPLNSYDALGNPLVYGNWNMSWTRGRLLHTMTPRVIRDGYRSSWEFRYDENGIRYRKIERNALTGAEIATTTFFVDGTRIVAQEKMYAGNTPNRFTEFFYDAQGITGMRLYGWWNIVFVRDVFGNVVEMMCFSGQTLARFCYDAWGNTVVRYDPFGMAHYNPFRYRGKFMDVGTGLYYMQTRFYDPAIRRFINADNYMLVPHLAGSMELNMHAYARNNPVMFTDPTGEGIFFTILAIIFVVSLAGLIACLSAMEVANAGGTRAEVAAAFFMGFGLGLLLGGVIVFTGGKALFALSQPVMLAISITSFNLGGIIIGIATTHHVSNPRASGLQSNSIEQRNNNTFLRERTNFQRGGLPNYAQFA